jgi:hypothetical protein
MKLLHFVRWLSMAALPASLPMSAQATGGRGMGSGLHFSGGRIFGFHHNRFFARAHFFRGNRFFARSRFGFVGVGFPYPYYCYPEPYGGY